ncbi:MAG TPA: PucR family transcriptional regulator ligand-binding domain-containing protein [Solirubrobacteraceae bacterium]|nr:PucR family transcriptional regulator ligand-binding domain-containing protein [Solirubrobacteraceae bacterium]
MSLTVESLVRELDLRLSSGEEAARTPVRWVHSTELLDPTPWLAGGELLLTTGMQLTGPKLQRELVARLHGHGIAGLGFGTGFTHERIPAALLRAARKLDFPVFEIPYELPFIAVTERALARLTDEQYRTLSRSVSIQERLERLVLEQRGLGELVRAIGATVGATVGVLDGHGEELAWHAHGRALGRREREGIARTVREASSPAGSPPAPFEPGVAEWEGEVLALPVIARDQGASHAWLIGASPTRLGDFERLILRQAVTVVALELMHVRIERATERRLAGDVLAEALTGRLHPEELQARLRPFGIGERAAVLAFSLHDPDAAASRLEGILARGDVRGLVATRGGLLCAVIDGGTIEREGAAAVGEGPLELARRVRAELARVAGEVRAGVSRVAPTHSLRLSFHEARCALEAVRFLNGSGPEVASYRDLGAFQLLLSLQDEDALISYCRGVLGPIEEGEGDYGDELLRSLDVFIEQNGHWERAASALFCHRHTLRYRIRRVEQLTGRDLSRARDRIEFWLALRGRELSR